MTKLRIATVDGSGASTIEEILSSLGARMHCVTSIDEARSYRCDGILLMGGTDILPFWYGEKTTFARGFDRERDTVEWTLARRALSEMIPTFGICRGHQMLAVAAGASLIQDIYEEGYQHHTIHDLIHVSKVLAPHIPTTVVNSYHHQAVRAAPFGFEVAARSKEGLIEAIYRPGFLGVQWHPEFLFNTDKRWRMLFRWFLAGLTTDFPGFTPGAPLSAPKPQLSLSV